MPKRLLVSWIAWYRDFVKGEGIASSDGPTYQIYRSEYLKPYDEHLLMSTAADDDERSHVLFTTLRREFPVQTQKLATHFTALRDPVDYQEVKAAVEQRLAAYRGWEIDIIFSSGTTVMRMVWVLFHLEQNGFQTRLIQGVDREMGQGQPGFRRLDLGGSTIAGRLDAVEASRQKPPADQYVPAHLAAIYEEATQAARAPRIPILIQGPSGSGKELLARHVHAQSARRERPFLAVNCAALGPDLLEARLFGFRKGSFTGAIDSREGYFEKADGGTLFLDEIGDVSPYLQQSLLRVLQEGTITRVGETEPRQIDVRIVAATNRDLVAASETGRFRWDLYYRLAVVELHLPALRDYPQADREGFIDFFIEQRRHLDPQGLPLQLSPEARAWLLAQLFPGNLRQLDTLITRLYVFCEGRITPADLARITRHRATAHDLTLAAHERRYLLHLLDAYDYNLSQTARVLDVALNTLKNKMDRYGISRQGEGGGSWGVTVGS